MALKDRLAKALSALQDYDTHLAAVVADPATTTDAAQRIEAFLLLFRAQIYWYQTFTGSFPGPDSIAAMVSSAEVLVLQTMLAGNWWLS